MLNSAIAGGREAAEALRVACLRLEVGTDWCVGCGQPEWWKLIKDEAKLLAHFEKKPGSQAYFTETWLPRYEDLARRFREQQTQGSP